MRTASFSKRRALIYGTVATVVVVVIIGVIVIWVLYGKKSTTYTGAIVTNGYGCSDVGKSIFTKGGSVADAAIATLFCEGVSMPQSMGLGGGFLLTIYERDTGIVKVLNARETAPLAATENMFNGNTTLSQKGGLSVAVPGELKGYWYLYKSYGYLSWSDLIQPTIDMCKNGIYVTAFLARTIKTRQDLLYADPTLRESFIDPETNNTYLEGQYVKRLKLAASLEIIAREGADALYSEGGSLIDGFVEDIQANGGIITKEDMQQYEPLWEEPITVTLSSGHTIYTSPLPGSGPVLVFILNILDGYLDFLNLYSSFNYQRIIESFKFAYGYRTKLGDNRVENENITQTVNEMISKSFAQDDIRAKLLDSSTSSDGLYYGAESTNVEDHGTAQVSILAPNGDAISVTSTINYIFGAGFASASTGIILNDEMDDFSSPNITSQFDIPPSPNNYIQPGKRPLSSMVPSLVLQDKDVVLVTGAAGGTKITTTIASLIIKHLWFGIDLDEAIQEKRVHHQLFPMLIEYEEGFDLLYPDIVANLTAIGHESKFTPTADGFSAVTSITTINSTIKAAFDNRRGGYISYLEKS